MKKFIVKIVGIFMAAVALSGCSGCVEDEQKEPQKELTGINAIFDEPLGWKNENPSVMSVSETERYVFYTRSSEAYSQSTSIAVRKGTFSGDAWQWNDAKVVLAPADGWESAHVYAPSVIKGDFTYNGESYNYLMAYSANENKGDYLGSQIGLAVAKTIDGDYTRIPSPIVTYSADEYSEDGFASLGVNEPSLVSFDRSCKVWLFYTYHGNNTTVGSRFIECDFSGDLNTIVARPGWTGNAVSSQFDGVETTNISPRAADYAYDAQKGQFVSVRNTSPYATSEPVESTGLQIVYGSEDILYSVPAGGWTLLRNVNTLMTVDTSDPSRYDGYSRIFSGGLVRDEYGGISGETIEFAFTSKALAATSEQYDFTSALHMLSVQSER